LDRKYLFDEIVLNYEKSRPCYSPQLLEDIISYANLAENQSAIEIGCGTGKATEPFLKTNCKITAIELGKNMASYTREKFKNSPNLEVIQLPFEEYVCGDNQFDLLYSATAFHWIPPEIGYPKAYRIIKSGGTLALFWSKSSANDLQNPLHQKIQSLYHEFLPQGDEKAAVDEQAKQEEIKNEIAKYGFTDVTLHLYDKTRTMTGEDYVALLDTYSDHRALDDRIRVPFYHAVRNAIEQFGNKVEIRYTEDLYLAHKP
jgi:Methylase involved in ubiquinone/menaquinone biosynthesis